MKNDNHDIRNILILSAVVVGVLFLGNDQYSKNHPIVQKHQLGEVSVLETNVANGPAIGLTYSQALIPR